MYGDRINGKGGINRGRADMADCVLTEKTPYCPGNPYSYTKELLEGLSRYYREYHDLDTVALRRVLRYGEICKPLHPGKKA